MTMQTARDFSITRTAMKAEMLDAETELRLAYAWRDERCEKSLHRLITAYMRLAVSMAGRFKRYGAPMNDLIQEAGLGLMKAADKFDPDKGVRFSTYAMWWIKASIQDHVMRNWSMVRTGSTSTQKSLFFNMRRVQARLEREAAGRGTKLDQHQLRQMISTEIGVPLRDVEMMEGRLSGSDYSLNATQSADDEGREWIEALEDDSAQAAEQVQEQHDRAQLRQWLVQAMGGLTEREQLIVRERKLRDQPRTLESLGDELSLSKERVRQLEAAAFGKMRQALEGQSKEVYQLLHENADRFDEERERGLWGHARRDWGMPAAIQWMRPNVDVFVILQGEEGMMPAGGGDLILDAPAPQRDDPCAAFNK